MTDAPLGVPRHAEPLIFYPGEKTMIRKHVSMTASLTLALALGACGGGTTETDDAVVDPAAAPADAVEPIADETAAAPAAEPMASDEPTVATADATDGWTAMQANWQDSAGLVKDRWAELTEEEILATAGDRDQLVGLVQDKYGIERDQAEQEVNDWADTL